MDDRPYGAGAADLADSRERRQAAQSTAPARGRSPRDVAPPDGTNAGQMQTPPQEPTPAPSPDQPRDTPPGGQELLGHEGGPTASDYARFGEPQGTTDWPGDVGRHIANLWDWLWADRPEGEQPKPQARGKSRGALDLVSGRTFANVVDPSGQVEAQASAAVRARSDAWNRGDLIGAAEASASEIGAVSPAPPPLPDGVIDVLTGGSKDPRRRALAAHAWVVIAGMVGGGEGDAAAAARLRVLSDNQLHALSAVVTEADRPVIEAELAKRAAARLREIGQTDVAARIEENVNLIAKETHDKRVAAQKAAGTFDPNNPIDFGDAPQTPATGRTRAQVTDETRAGPLGDVRPGGVQPSGTPQSGVGRTKAVHGAQAPMAVEPRAPTDPPAPPSAPIRYPTEENLGIDKGTMDSLPENLRRIVVDEARADYAGVQDARGGVVSDAQRELESNQVLVDAGILAQAQPRTPLSAPGMRAVKRALFRVASERAEIEAQAAQAGANVSDELRGRFAVKVFEQNSLQRVIAGGRAEWGRVGQELQRAVDERDPVRMTKAYDRIIKALGGRTNVDLIRKRLQDIRDDPRLLGDPYARQVAEHKYIDSIRPRYNWRKIDEAFQNAILSIPATHEAYVFGMAVFHQAEALAKLPTAAVDAVLGGLTDTRTGMSLRGEGPRYTFSQALAGIAGAEVGIPKGLIAGMRAIATGETRAEVDLFGAGTQDLRSALESKKGPLTQGLIDANVPVLSGVARAVPAGADVIRLPTRIINGYTAAFHEAGREASLWEQAVATAEREMPKSTLFDPKLRARAAELVATPTDEMTVAARKAGQRASLRGRVDNPLAGTLRGLRDFEIPSRYRGVPTGPLAHFRPFFRVFPFVDIGFNILRPGLEYSPLGFAKVPFVTGTARSAALAKAGMGSLIWKFFLDKADGGQVTGALPDDPNERALWQREGRLPYAINFGGTWYPYDRFEPIATTLKWVSGFNDAVKAYQQSPSKLDAALLETTAAKILGTMARGIGDTSWNTGISELARIATSKDQAAAANNYIGQQLSAQVPFSGGLRRTAQAVDPYVRQPSGIEQQIEATLPGYSALTPAALDAWGEKVRRPESQQGLRGVIDFTRASREQTDPVDAELAKHLLTPRGDATEGKQILISTVQADIDNYKLSGEEGRMLRTLAGRAAHQALAELFLDHGEVNVGTAGAPLWKRYSAMTEEEKTKAIEKTISESRQTARGATADAILHSATTDAQLRRAVEMRLSTITRVADRADFLAGLDRQGKLSAAVRAYLNERRRTGERTVEEYLRMARG